MKSDVIVAVNTILPAVNAAEHAAAAADPSYVSMRAMCYTLLAACLEGREDAVVHVELRRRIPIPMVLAHAQKLEDLVNRGERVGPTNENKRNETKRNEKEQKPEA